MSCDEAYNIMRLGFMEENVMSMPLAPCEKCERRQVGCHSKCQEFAKFQQDMKIFNERISDSYRHEYAHYKKEWTPEETE